MKCHSREFIRPEQLLCRPVTRQSGLEVAYRWSNSGSVVLVWPVVQGRAQDFSSREAMTEGTKAESERGWGYWGGAGPSGQLGLCLGTVVSFCGVWGGAPTTQRFSTFSALHLFFWYYNIDNVDCSHWGGKTPVPQPLPRCTPLR